MKRLNLTPEQKKEAFGEGPWVDEPDYLEFDHEGYKCIVKRIVVKKTNSLFGGHICGYIVIPESHPWHGKDNTFKIFWDCEVHGGITFSEELDGVYCVGFDCGHLGDIVPSMIKIRDKIREECPCLAKESKLLFPLLFTDTYRTFDYVIEECKKLAMEVKAAEKKRKK